ncbi:MAG: endolytic transglycosylase MltG [Myxococcales bacterium]|nr:endolytic transglycosylase MltG [Myxococcales bacterium]
MILALLACVDPDAPIAPGDDTVFLFEVPKGASASGLGGRLVENGLAPSEWQWKLFLRQADGGCLKAGKFKVRRSMSLTEVLTTLCGAPVADEVPFAILEGWRIRDIDDALAEAGRIEPGAYKAAVEARDYVTSFALPANSLEGYLYPETYQIPAEGRIDAHAFVQRQLDLFADRFVSRHPDGFGKRSLHDVVTMASMLEREEPRPEQRPLVAGILWKRIDAGWALGVDATSRYTLDVWNDRRAFLQKLRDPADPWNTRKRVGLPPTPIGNPSLPSLEAAAAPVDSEFWYYLHDSTGTLRPAKDSRGHEANRKRYDVY